MTVDVLQLHAVRPHFAVNYVTQDGYTTGRLIGIDIDETGVVQARFTNGRSQPLGQVAIVELRQRRRACSSSATRSWAETFASGQALRGQAGNSAASAWCSPARSKSSNVDITAAAGEHDHRAAQLPGERADDLAPPTQVTQTIINIR